MKSGGGERLELIWHCMHVLQRVKRDYDKRIFLAQTEVAHVSVVQSYTVTYLR